MEATAINTFFDRVNVFVGTVDALQARPQDSSSEGFIVYRTHIAARAVIMYQVPGMLSPDRVSRMQQQLLSIAPMLADEFTEARIMIELQGWNTLPSITIQEN